VLDPAILASNTLQGIKYGIWWLRNTTHARRTSPKEDERSLTSASHVLMWKSTLHSFVTARMSHAGLSPVGVDCRVEGKVRRVSLNGLPACLCFRGLIPSPKESLEFVFLDSRYLGLAYIHMYTSMNRLCVILSTDSAEVA
jgi:hypothetical protein